MCIRDRVRTALRRSMRDMSVFAASNKRCTCLTTWVPLLSLYALPYGDQIGGFTILALVKISSPKKTSRRKISSEPVPPTLWRWQLRTALSSPIHKFPSMLNLSRKRRVSLFSCLASHRQCCPWGSVAWLRAKSFIGLSTENLTWLLQTVNTSC